MTGMLLRRVALQLEDYIDLIVKVNALLLVGLRHVAFRSGSRRFVHARYRHRLLVGDVITNAVNRPQFRVEAFRQ